MTSFKTTFRFVWLDILSLIWGWILSGQAVTSSLSCGFVQLGRTRRDPVDLMHIFFNLDHYLGLWAQIYGPWLYLGLFLIIFAETGLVVAPFLPGDSLLFAVGALTSLELGGLSLGLLSILLVLAALLGDNLNYRIGSYLGPKVFVQERSLFFSRKHLERTQNFYSKHGTKAVVMARFVPIVRTFVPFVAGVGRMPFKKYLFFSFFGAVLWTQIFLWAGHLFGQAPAVKRHFHFVIFGVIFLSILPVLIGVLKSRRRFEEKLH